MTLTISPSLSYTYFLFVLSARHPVVFAEDDIQKQASSPEVVLESCFWLKLTHFLFFIFIILLFSWFFYFHGYTVHH